MKAVLPLAGNGTRMYPLGVTTPKCLLPILNKPLLLWSLESLQQNGITEVVLVVSEGPFGDKIKEYVHSLTDLHLTIHFAVQKDQLGTAHVVQMAKEYFQPGEEFIFLYGDDLYGPQNIAKIIATPGLAVMGKEVNDPEKWGIFQANEHGDLQNVIEKPSSYVGNLANIGCMKLDYRVFEIFDQLQISPRGEFELTDTLQALAHQTTVKVVSTTDYWIPVGYPWHILDANNFFMNQVESKIEGTIEDNVVIKGTVVLPKTSIIKSGTYIEGNLVVGENTVIGPNSFIRENVVVGDNSYIGFCSEVKNVSLGNRTRIPHHGVVGDSVIGDDVNISAHCVVANVRHDGQNVSTPIKGKVTDTGRHKFGTVIGNGVKLGIGTLIYPGRKIWPNKITHPGEIVDKDLID